MTCGSGTDAAMDLCGRTCPPLMYISSFTITSSPSTVLFSIRTHCPTTLRHPTMQPSSQECDRTVAPLSSVLRFTHTPSSITTPGPTVTFGPIRQPCPILAVGSTRTFPTMPGPLWRALAFFWRSEVKYRHIPEQQQQLPLINSEFKIWSSHSRVVTDPSFLGSDTVSLSDYYHANICMVQHCMKKLTQCHLQKTGMFSFEFSIYGCEKHTTIWMFTAVLLIVHN